MRINSPNNKNDSGLHTFCVVGYKALKKKLIITAILMLGSGAAAISAETVTYSYDARGRLIKVVRAGTVNNGIQTTYSHDKANNRKNTTTTGSANPSPEPPPPPNLPPVANADAVSVQCNIATTKNVTANDTDPEGNLPLTVQSASLVSGTASVSVISASTVQVTGGTAAGQSQASYVVADSLGATSTGSITITTTGTPAQCLQ